MKKIRWGILSTAKIGVEKVIPAIQASTHSEVMAISSQSLDKARVAATKLGIPKVYGSYEELLDDPDIDAIYNPLPNHLHVDWSVKAIRAGKHVLCEKPIGLSTKEAEQLLAAATAQPELKVMEAFMYRFHPQWQRARQLVDEGAIGNLGAIQSFFSYYNVDAANIRNRTDVGGGGLMDIGCYCLSLSRFIFGAEPRRVMGAMLHDDSFGTDYLTSGLLDFGSGTSVFTCSTQLAPYQRVNILGTTGRIEIEIPFNAPPDQPCRMWLQTNGKLEEIIFATCNQYTLQAEVFCQAILDNTAVPTPLTDAVDNMRVLEGIVESARSGSWVVIS
ncbi:Gfo/Idh/MocA family protein [Desulfopila aestuarii]|nr:Gfo/Idh/MocA family oxidoreductase [Desulfopila aestuarii]